MQHAQNETILGVIRELKIGFDDFDMVFTNRRLAVVKVSTSGYGVVFGGLVGAILTDLLNKEDRDRVGRTDIEGLVAADKKNFALPYGTIERMELNGGISAVTLPSITLRARGKKWRFGMTSSFWKKDQSSIANAKRLMQTTLGARAEFKKV